MTSELAYFSFDELVEATDYVANGSFASLKENVTYHDGDGYAVLVRLVDHNAGWQGQRVYVDENAYKFLSKSSLIVGDIVISNVGANAGTVFRVPVLGKPATLGPNAIRVRPRQICTDRLNQGYLYYYLVSPLGQDSLQSIITGSAQPKFNKTALRSLKIPLPPFQVQNAISTLMQGIDDRITLLRETNTILEQIAQTIFKSWFVDFDPVRAKQEGRMPEGIDEDTAALFPDSFEESELRLVPRGWRLGTLGDLADFQNGYAFKSKDWTDVGHPVVKIGEVKPGIIKFLGCSFVSPITVNGLGRFRLNRGDLLVGMTGYVGETGLVPSVEPPAYLNQRVGKIEVKSECDRAYVYFLTRDPSFKEYAEAQSHGSAQANVSGASLMSYPSIVANEAVMGAFGGLASSLLESILTNHEKTQILADLRDTLLPRLISGKLRLPEAEDMIEEANV